MIDNSMLATLAASASRIETNDYPVYAAAPLYVRETLLFPYTYGLLFQQAVVEKQGGSAFLDIFRRPPLSSQHILQPDTYFQGRRPSSPALPKIKRPRGFKKVSEGQIGQLDHLILLKQYAGDKKADALSPKWRGGRYEILEDRAKSRAVLLYAAEWESAADAEMYFDLYRKICKKKWKSVSIERQTDHEVVGHSETGQFVIARRGAAVTSIEGLPDKAWKASEEARVNLARGQQ